MKTNFKKEKEVENHDKSDKNSKNTDLTKDEIKNNSSELTQEEFEEFIIKSGAKGSFMVYRSDKKEDELGLDEL